MTDTTSPSSTRLEVTRDGYLISDDPQKLDIGYVTGFLTQESYWSKSIDPLLIKKAIDNSLSLGVYKSGKQVGFARIVTDFTLFAYYRDVFIDNAYRGHGLGLWLTQTAVAHPRLQTISSWMLATGDAHDLYSKVGFKPLPHPEWYMHRTKSD